MAEKAGLSSQYELFSASVEQSFDSTQLSISESSFISIQLFIRHETWKLQTLDTKYMYPGVVDDFDTKDGKWLIEQYGGGVVMGMDIGGRWTDNITISKHYEHSTRDVMKSLKSGYGMFLQAHISTAVSEAVANEKSIVHRQVDAIGGNPGLAPGKLEEWELSVKKNPAFIDFS